MNAKAKGNRSEHKTMRLLESLGYSCTRSSSSIGAFDVLAIGPKDVRLIQFKSNRWPGSVEMEAIELFACPSSCTKEIWRWNDHARQPVVKVIA